MFQELQNWKEQNGGEDYIGISAGWDLEQNSILKLPLGDLLLAVVFGDLKYC